MRRWTSAQNEALARSLYSMPDVHEQLPRAEVQRRQELLRGAVAPLRSWVSIYIKIWRDLALGHVLKSKLGNSCRQHVLASREGTAGEPATHKLRAGQHARKPTAAVADACAVEASGDACLVEPYDDARAVEPYDDACLVEPYDDDALDSPRVLLAPGADEQCVYEDERLLDVWEACACD